MASAWYEPTDLDHLEAVDGQSDPKFWDKTNHQGLCKECRGMKTAMERLGGRL